MKKIAAIVAILFAGLIITSFFSCQSTRSATASRFLKFDYQSGDSYDYEMVMEMTQQVMGQEMQMDVANYYSMAVTGEQDGIKTITTTFEKIKMKIGMMGMEFEIDTENPDNGTSGENEFGAVFQKLAGFFTAIKGQQFSMKVNEEGKVLEVAGMEKLISGIVDSIGLSEVEKQRLGDQFREQMNDNSMKEQFGRFWYIFPNREVKVGDKWEKTSQAAGKVSGSYYSVYEVAEIEGDMVTLKENTEVRDEKGVQSGKIDGNLVVDSRSGLIVSGSQLLKMEIVEGGITVKMEAKTKIKGVAR